MLMLCSLFFSLNWAHYLIDTTNFLSLVWKNEWIHRGRRPIDQVIFMRSFFYAMTIILEFQVIFIYGKDSETRGIFVVFLTKTKFSCGSEWLRVFSWISWKILNFHLKEKWRVWLWVLFVNETAILKVFFSDSLYQQHDDLLYSDFL